MLKKINDQTSRIKNKDQQARSHSQMEAKLHNTEIITSTQESQAKSKRVYKRKRVDAVKRAVIAKKERDEHQMETILAVGEKPYSRMISFSESKKANLLNSSADG
jgi:hypothetical protein